MKKPFGPLARRNTKLAKGKWLGELGKPLLQTLGSLTENYGFSVALGDLLLLEGRWYVTHAGLLRLAARSRCHGIHVQQVREFCDPVASRWVFKASVYKSSSSRGFIGYGDADPSNVSALVHGAELRIAETRAVNRALRKAYGIGLCSVEELGVFSSQPRSSASPPPSNGHSSSNGNRNGQPRLRDQLCLLIRQYNLDANLVRAYAADFCGTQTLSGASR
ncbi:MAG: hypothetical protein WBU20_20695, partial [Candidatus Acidiferrum sp.]